MTRENPLDKKVLAELLPRRPRRNLVISLLTVGDDGYPNVCLLSPYQVVAKDERTIFLAVYEGSKTSANLANRREATLVLFLPPAAYYIKGDVEPASKSPVQGNDFHVLKVTGTTRDYYQRAPLTSAVRFERKNVLPAYSRVFKALARAASGTA